MSSGSHQTNIFATSLKGAACLFLVSAAVIGWETSTAAQVAVYDWTTVVQTRVISGLPTWLTGADAALDAAVPLLTRPLAASILKETYTRHQTSSETHVQSVQQLAHDLAALTPIVHDLRLAARLLEPQVAAAPWWLRCRPVRLWVTKPVSPEALFACIESAADRAAAEDVRTFVPELNVTTRDVRLQIRSPLEAFHTYAKRVDSVVLPDSPTLLVQALQAHWKSAAATALHGRLVAGVAAETELRSSASLTRQWNSEEAALGRIVAAVETAARQCEARCGRFSEGATLVRRLLDAVTASGARFPEAATLQVLETLASPYRAPELSRRELERLLTVEAFRRAPNRWLAMAGLAAGIGVATFLGSVAYQIAWILSVGILGTAVNLVGTVYDMSAELRERQRLRQRMPRRLENDKIE